MYKEIETKQPDRRNIFVKKHATYLVPWQVGSLNFGYCRVNPEVNLGLNTGRNFRRYPRCYGGYGRGRNSPLLTGNRGDPPRWMDYFRN